ncbi:MAG: hypothetical protein HRU14_14790 [Planctomycetes bacterium]|nr:hypothetical protein [Planctomycetota bacterium]
MSIDAIARGLLIVSLALVAVTVHGQQPPLLQSVTLRSGNAAIGATDPQTSMLVGPANAPFAAAFTAASFASASSGPPAVVISPNPAWLAALPSDPVAQWIATVASGFNQGSALFAIDFTVLPSTFVSATLTLDYVVDNYIGSSIAPGVYLNGMPLSGNTFLPACAPSGCAAFFAPQVMVRTDIAPLLLPGNNTLYIYLNDTGVTGGLLFSATIDIYGFTSPEYQTNFSFAASLDVNGVQGTAYAPATVTVPIGMTATLGLVSVNVGQQWDLGSGLAPLIPASTGALISSDGQIVNLDLTDPTLSLWFNFLQGPSWGPLTSVSIPFSLSYATAVSAQMVVVDPGLMSGIALSQPVRLIVQ